MKCSFELTACPSARDACFSTHYFMHNFLVRKNTCALAHKCLESMFVLRPYAIDARTLPLFTGLMQHQGCAPCCIPASRRRGTCRRRQRALRSRHLSGRQVEGAHHKADPQLRTACLLCRPTRPANQSSCSSWMHICILTYMHA